MSFSLKANFLANARGVTFEDTASAAWSFNANTNEITCAAGGGVTGSANPTAKVGLSAVNGAAATFMRSDGAPPLDQSIAPTWTGLHSWVATPTNTGMANGAPTMQGGQLGTSGSPTTSLFPLMTFTKYLNTSAVSTYSGGAGWFQEYVEGGTGWGKALTGYCQVDGGTTISGVGAMGYGVASATATGASVWGLWCHAHDLATAVQNQAIGLEADVVFAVDRPRVTGAPGSNPIIGLWVVNQADELGNFNGTFAVGISGETNAGGHGFTSKWRSGYFVEQNSIVGGSGTHEAFQINGGTSAANRYTGIRFLQQFDLGIDMSNATFTGGTYALFLSNGSAKGGVIGFNDSVSGNYPGIYLNNATLNALVLGQSVPGGLVFSTCQRDQSKVTQAVSATGQTKTMANNTSTLILNITAAANTVAACTVDLPATPLDGQIARILVNGTVTTLTINGNSFTVNTTYAASLANDGIIFLYDATLGWLRDA